MLSKITILCVYTAIVAVLTTVATQMFFSAHNTPKSADDIFNGRNFAGKCVKTESTQDVYQLQCSSLSIRINARDYERSIRAWELTGERRPSK